MCRVDTVPAAGVPASLVGGTYPKSPARAGPPGTRPTRPGTHREHLAVRVPGGRALGRRVSCEGSFGVRLQSLQEPGAAEGALVSA